MATFSITINDALVLGVESVRQACEVIALVNQCRLPQLDPTL